MACCCVSKPRYLNFRRGSVRPPTYPSSRKFKISISGSHSIGSVFFRFSQHHFNRLRCGLFQQIEKKIPYKTAHEGTIWVDNFRFNSFIFHSIEYIEVVKSLKGFLPNHLPSTVIVVLLNFQVICVYLPIKLNYGILIWNFVHSQI